MTTITISLPKSIAQKIDTEAQKHGYATRSEFIRNLVRKHFSKEEAFEVFKPKPLAQIKLELAATGKYSAEFIESIIEGLKKSSEYAG